MYAIVVVDRNWAIGKNGDLLFTLPIDMKRFRSLTTGGTVLMGHRTLESFPGGKPLPRRRNIVLTSEALDVPGVEVVHSLEELRQAASSDDPDHVFVIGGGSVYAAMLPYCKRVFLTKVDAAGQDPDTFFPNLDKLPGWKVEAEGDRVTENGITYRFVDYINTRPAPKN